MHSPKPTTFPAAKAGSASHSAVTEGQTRVVHSNADLVRSSLKGSQSLMSVLAVLWATPCVTLPDTRLSTVAWASAASL